MFLIFFFQFAQNVAKNSNNKLFQMTFSYRKNDKLVFLWGHAVHKSKVLGLTFQHLCQTFCKNLKFRRLMIAFFK